MRRAAAVAPVLAMAHGPWHAASVPAGAEDRIGSSQRGSNRASGTGVRLRRLPVDRNGCVGQRARRSRPRCGTRFAPRTERLERGPLMPSGSSIRLPSGNQNLTMDRTGLCWPVWVLAGLDDGLDRHSVPDGLLEPQTDVGKTENQVLPVISSQTRKEPKK